MVHQTRGRRRSDRGRPDRYVARAVLAERVPGARLAIVADPRPDAGTALARRFGARAITDPAELFADADVDAVVIAASSERTPTWSSPRRRRESRCSARSRRR